MPESGKTRSPLYPAISLRDAVTKAEMLFNQEHLHVAGRDVVARALGYATVNGSSNTVISALSKYGLVDTVPRGIKVSELALDIITRERGEFERRRAVQEAAIKPTLFSELHEHYGNSLPSDQNLRAYLIRNRFNPHTVDVVVRAYRDTVEYLHEEAGSSYVEPTEELRNEEDSLPPMMKPTPPSGPRVNATEPASDADFVVRIGDGCTVRAVFTGEVTQEAIQKLIQYLEVSKDTYPAQKKPPAQ